MTIVIKDLRLSLGQDEQELFLTTIQHLGVHADELSNFRIVRMSLDARRKQDIHYICTVEANLHDEESVLRKRLTGVSSIEQTKVQPVVCGIQPMRGRPVVVGTGPCGMFAALLLARRGYAPIVIERGDRLQERVGVVNRLWTQGVLDPQSNVLFGEGGAGTFSDGKLTTRIKDTRCADVLRVFVEMGAPQHISYMAKPHIGTDLLRIVVSNIRAEIERLGGQYLFNTKLIGFTKREDELTGIKLEGAHAQALDTSALVLAIGHSARDTYDMLLQEGCELQPKSFAVGVRIEHPQELIDVAQYGSMAGDVRLGSAEYALAAKGTRGVYTFCMCPGGLVVCSASEEGGIVTNGMSYNARNARNANSAIIVQVTPNDFGSQPLDGVRFQRQIERRAYEAGGGGFVAPAQTVGDFLLKKKPVRFGSIKPSYLPSVVPCDLWDVLPQFCAEGIAQALPAFGRQLKGFDTKDAVMTAVESRSSAPVRIVRSENGEASLHGVYPCGEGAGYAGGIVSAAVDGLKAAERIITRFVPPK